MLPRPSARRALARVLPSGRAASRTSAVGGCGSARLAPHHCRAAEYCGGGGFERRLELHHGLDVVLGFSR